MEAERDAYQLTDADKEMLRQRMSVADANPDDCVPWEEVRAAIQARLERKGL